MTEKGPGDWTDCTVTSVTDECEREAVIIISTLQAESGLNDYETGETSWK